MTEFIAPKYKPRCNICNSELEGISNPPPVKGKGYCPQGRMYFTFEGDSETVVVLKDKNGNEVKSGVWKLKGNGIHQ